MQCKVAMIHCAAYVTATHIVMRALGECSAECTAHWYMGSVSICNGYQRSTTAGNGFGICSQIQADAITY
eukprot:19791-Heterococcus_DN1.PRE.3